MTVSHCKRLTYNEKHYKKLTLMFEKSFLIVREVTDLTWFSNETTDKCWSTLCKKKGKKIKRNTSS